MGTNRTPETNSSVEQLGEEIIQRIKEQAASTPVPTVVWNDSEVEVVKGNQYRASVWLHGPAMLQLMANAWRRMLKVAAETKTDLNGNALELTGNKITKVRAARAKGKKIIYVVPTSDSDTEGIPVNMIKGSAYVNLISLLSPAKLTVATGYRERYEAEFAENGKDLVYPALKISLVSPLERRRANRKKEEEESQPATKSAATEAKAPEAKPAAPKAVEKTEPTKL